MTRQRSGNQYTGGKLILELEPRILLSADQPVAALAADLLDDPLAPQDSVLIVSPQYDERQTVNETHEFRELVIVDAATPDAQQLLTDLLLQVDDGRIVEVAVLDSHRDGIDQVSELLADRSDLSALHIISHGRDGSILLGNREVDQDELVTRGVSIQGWSDAFATEGDILIYGCNLASGAEGREFVAALARLTDTDVAASTDRTGAAGLGGDWDLEFAVGQVETTVALNPTAQATYSGVLDAVVLTQYNASDAAYEIKSDQNHGQSFSYTSGNGTYDASFIDLTLMREAGATSQTLTVELRDSWNGTILASASMNTDDLSTSATQERFGFDTVTLTDGQSYTIRIGTDSLAGQVHIDVDSAAASYGNGTYIDKDGFSQGGEDLWFRVGHDVDFGLEGHWKLDETVGTTAVDSSGNGNDGTLGNMDPGTDWVAGQVGGGLDFDGTNDYVDVGSDSSLDDIFVNGGTVSAWIYAADWGDIDQGRIVDKSSNVNAKSGWVFQVDGTSGNNRLRFEAGFSGSDGGWVTPDNSISLGSWIHVAVVYDSNTSANDATLYVNGVALSVTEINNPSGDYQSDAAYAMRIGNFANGTQRTFEGVIDDVRMYGRALTADEIAKLAVVAPAVTVNPLTTTDNRPQLTGTIDDPTATIQVTVDGTVYAANNNGDGTWTLADDAISPALVDGTYDVVVTATDGLGNAGNDATTDELVVDTNSAPVITSNGGGPTAAVNVAENQTAVTTVTYTDTDIPADSITYSLSGDDAALFSISAGGILTFVASPDFETPIDFDLNGVYEVTVNIDDNAGGVDTQAISATIINANDTPVANNDIYVVAENDILTTVAGIDGVTQNDTDADVNLLTVNTTPVTGPANGSLILNADGTFTYTPDPDFNGIDSFTYEIDDGNGAFSQATATISITPTNSIPVVTVAGYVVSEDNTLTSGSNHLLLNATDPDGDTLTVSATPASGPANGILVLGTDGSFTYTPNTNFNGTDGFVFDVSDGNGATIQVSVGINIVSVNDAPTLTMDNLIAPAGAPVSFGPSTILSNDSDAENDALSIVSFSAPSFGALVQTNDGNYIYTPNPGFEGIDSFSYTVTDTNGAIATATILVDVSGPVITTTDDIEPTDIPTTDGTGEDSSDEPAVEPETESVPEPSMEAIPEPETGPIIQTLGSGRSEEALTPLPNAEARGSFQWAKESDRNYARSSQIPDKFVNDTLLEGIEIQGFGLRSVNLSQAALWQALDTMKSDMSRLGGGQDQNSAVAVTEIAAGSSIALSVGFLSWVLRGGALASTLLTTMPMWRGFDPLPLLAARRKKKKDADPPHQATDKATIWYRTRLDQTTFNSTKAERFFSASQTDVRGDDAS